MLKAKPFHSEAQNTCSVGRVCREDSLRSLYSVLSRDIVLERTGKEKHRQVEGKLFSRRIDGEEIGKFFGIWKID